MPRVSTALRPSLGSLAAAVQRLCAFRASCTAVAITARSVPPLWQGLLLVDKLKTAAGEMLSGLWPPSLAVVCSGTAFCAGRGVPHTRSASLTRSCTPRRPSHNKSIDTDVLSAGFAGLLSAGHLQR